MNIKLHKKSISIRSDIYNDPDYGHHYLDEHEIDRIVSRFKIDKIGTLAASYDHSPNSIRAGTSDQITFIRLGDTDGIEGNSNRKIKSTNGWRGTTNDRAVYAHGIIQIVSITKLKRGYAYIIKIKYLPEAKCETN